IGHPIAHSLSPALFGHIARATGLPIDYRRLDIPPARLRETLRVFREQPLFAGWNVTIPHKAAIAKLVDERSRAAELLGAVNVVRFSEGRLLGDNTDVAGVDLTFARHGVELRGEHATIYGAGGAAMAVGFVLGSQRAREVAIVNRTPANARKVAARLAKAFPRTRFVANPRAATPSTLYVNTTPLGMSGFAQKSLLPADAPRGAWAFDVVYRPERTLFLRQARRQGLRPIGGLEMLIGQALGTYDLWFAAHPLTRAKRTALFTSLLRYLRTQL
ncbi:MAG: shikimate dehydrogenase, partial [Deltaproteobacteria bacterium]|nr:shikimate dehydrogenase [Deltaproteobacteria bacterium]